MHNETTRPCAPAQFDTDDAASLTKVARLLTEIVTRRRLSALTVTAIDYADGRTGYAVYLNQAYAGIGTGCGSVDRMNGRPVTVEMLTEAEETAWDRACEAHQTKADMAEEASK